MSTRFGLGQKTGIGLPAESPGSFPAPATWSARRSATCPIGQGVSMTVLQMAGMYQAIANNGVRIPPRIVEATVTPDGVRTVAPAPAAVQVMSPQTAATLLTCSGGHAGRRRQPPRHRTGGGHHRLPGGGQDRHGAEGRPGVRVLLADRDVLDHVRRHGPGRQDPRYVIGDHAGRARRRGTSAAPLFHDIAAYLAPARPRPADGQPRPAPDVAAALTRSLAPARCRLCGSGRRVPTHGARRR